MASEFIGYTILVTLQNPFGAQLQGVVSDVLNQRLYLRDVLLRWNGQRLPHYTVDAGLVADLEIAPSQNDVEAPTPTTVTAASHVPSQSTPFVDPAILAYTRPSAGPQQQSQPQLQPHSQTVPGDVLVSPIMIADGVPSTSKATPALRGVSSVSSIATTQHAKIGGRGSNATATLTEPFDALSVSGKSEKNTNANKHASQTGPGIIDMKDVNNGPLKPKKAGKGKGWRNTPFLEETSNKTPNRRQRGRKPLTDDANGWATEDATDIQDMGEFDFESNLSKFDKRRVFDDIRKDDKVADSDRLVSFNRKSKPGTNGGRNLHFTENVLDGPVDLHDTRWKSEAGETEDDAQEDQYGNVKKTKRTGSRRPPPSRKGSTMPANPDRSDLPIPMPVPVPVAVPMSRMNTSSPLNGSFGVRAAFRLNINNKLCPAVSPLQMLEIEQLCQSEMGLTEDMLTENAGRSIAEAILKCSDAEMVAGTVNSANTPTGNSVSAVRNILFLVGNHKSGARAIAAARHLANRRLRVTVCLLGGEREELLLEVVRKQLGIYKSGGGYVVRWDAFQTRLAAGGVGGGNNAGTNGTVATVPDLVVDALLGIHTVFEELRTDDQAAVFEMVKWINRGIRTLSVDVPSGLSASSGLPAESEGVTLMVNSQYVVCLAAPKVGLLNAMATDIVDNSWSVMVADIGVSGAAWQKHGSRRRHGTDFGNEWVVGVKLLTL